jgi:hypothetical protein
LRDKTGGWAAGVFVAVGIMVVAGILWTFAREHLPGHHEDPVPV